MVKPRSEKSGSKTRAIIISLIVSSVFIFFAMDGINWRAFKHSFSTINLFHFSMFVVFTSTMVFFRTLRSYYLIIKIPGPLRTTKKIFGASLIGFGAILLLPLRTGELVRPWLLASPRLKAQHKTTDPNKRMRFSSLIGASVVERILDGLIISFMLLAIFTWRSLEDPSAPSWLLPTSIFTSMLFLFGSLLLITAVKHPIKTLNLTKKITFIDQLSRKFTHFKKLSLKFESLFHGITSGFSTISKSHHLILFLLITLLYWLANGLGVWFLAKAFQIPLPFWGAISVMGLIVIGIFIPSSPAHIGNFHHFARLGLTISIPAALVTGSGMAMVVTLHAVQLIIYILGATIGFLIGGYKKPIK
jgi:glycosyltransferase 2 family protein